MKREMNLTAYRILKEGEIRSMQAIPHGAGAIKYILPWLLKSGGRKPSHGVSFHDGIRSTAVEAQVYIDL